MQHTPGASLEQSFFRRLNAVVEPAVRRGIGSPRLLPAGLILLESVGYLSGKKRRTPLLSFRFGPYRVVSTARGERSFWLRNLAAEPRVNFFVGGRRRAAEAIVIDEEGSPEAAALPLLLRPLVRLLGGIAQRGWRFAILVPAPR